MTKHEHTRRATQEATLRRLGFTMDECDQLRRISARLRRWHEGTCGSDHRCLVRGRWNQETASFDYDDDTGRPYWEFAGLSGRARYQPTADLERGAMRRLKAILGQRNGRPCIVNGQFHVADPRGPVYAYVQPDPRGAALYLIRPGDVPDGGDVSSYYTRGICVY